MGHNYFSSSEGFFSGCEIYEHLNFFFLNITFIRSNDRQMSPNSIGLSFYLNNLKSFEILYQSAHCTVEF